ncbi:MAG: long-chain fatty acid--CoA ligase [Acidimicrobiia bacterium]
MTKNRVWLKSYAAGVPHSLAPKAEQSLFDVLDDAAQRFPERPAIAFLRKHLTYHQLLDSVERFSAALASMGVEKGDRVGLILPNCPQYVIAYYASLRLGAIVVGNNPQYTQRELGHQLRDAGPTVVVVLDQLYPNLAAIRDQIPSLEQVIVTRLTDYMGFPLKLLAPLKFRKEARQKGRAWPPVPKRADVQWWKALMRTRRKVPAPVEVDPKQDPAGLIYTGGTTGLSKGAVLTHHNLVTNCRQSSVWLVDLRDGEESVMCILPFFHAYGMTVGMNLGIYKAAKLILLPRFNVEATLKEIERERPSLFPGVPRIYSALNQAAEGRTLDLSSIRACLSGAAKLPLAVAEQFEALTGGRVIEGYGLTETSPLTHANPISDHRKAGSFGLPIPDTDCRVVDLDDPTVSVPPEMPGELAISGPQVMAGYWNQPTETAAMIRDGWLYTGDIVRMDEDGYFFLVDRKKEVVIVSGFNVYPTEVEEMLHNHPKVARVAVIGVPDEATGEAVKAFVVLRQGETATPQEIIEWCRNPEAGLTGYRVPKQIEFRDSLPETLVGKVLRRVLREENTP